MSAATQDIASEIEKDGPFAFPFVATGVLCTGMTLRDYFAAKAMPNLISLCMDSDGAWSQDTVAQNAYALADAMLKAREAA